MAENLTELSETEQGFLESVDDFLDVPAPLVRQTSADPVGIVTKITGIWPAVQAMRPIFIRLFDFNAKAFDKLPTYIKGLTYANANYNIRMKTPDNLLKNVAEAIELRGVMRTVDPSRPKTPVLPGAPGGNPFIS